MGSAATFMKQAVLRFWPILFLVIFWFIFASPYFIKGKVPFPSTYQINYFPPWSSYAHNGIPVKNGAMPDVITQIYPWRHLTMEIWKSGQIPLWNPYSFAGTPLLANYQSAVLSPFNVLFFLLPFVDGWSILVLLQPLLAGLFTYLFVRKIKVGKSGSLIAGVAFMFCGFITSWMSYATLPYAILFLPLALFALEAFFENERRRYLLLFASTIPLSFFSGHFQISLYFLLSVFAYWLYLCFIYKEKRKAMKSGLIFFFGFLFTMPQILPSMEFYTQSLRSGIYIRSEIIPWMYLPTLFAPDFFGNPVTRNDWFGHYAEWNSYIGVLPLLLGIYTIRTWKGKRIPFFLLLGFLALLLALPTPLGDAIVWMRIPVLSTSAASRIIVLFSFSFAVLSGFGFDQLLSDLEKRRWKPLLIFSVIISVIFTFLWGIVFGKLFLPIDKIAIAKQNLILPTIFFISSFIIIFFGFLQKKVIWIVACVILLLSAFDMYRFVTKWQPFDPKQYVFQEVGATDMFAKIAGYKRVLGNYDEDIPVYYHLPTIEGYDALYPKYSGEFASSLFNGKFTEGQRSVVIFPKYGTYTKLGLDLLGFSYIAHKKSDDNRGWTFEYWKYPASTFPLIMEDSAYRILENKDAYPRAFLVTNYVVENNLQKTLTALFSKYSNPRQTVVLEQKPSFSQFSATEKNLSIVSYTPNVITLQSQTNGNTLLFLSDSFFPGWQATIDGKTTQILRADLAFRAIALPKGNHMIIFSYYPLSFVIGVFLAIISLSGVLGVTLVSKKPFISKI